MTKIWNPSSSFSLLALCIIAININSFTKASLSRLPTIFMFGDSTMDVGTNNFLPSILAKANFPYNGIDFPKSIPTGRFCNGYNIGDQIAMQFGLKKSPPAFLRILNQTSIDLKKIILRGVSFASGGSGILRETGLSAVKEVVPLAEQIEQFATVRGNITEVKGQQDTAKILSKAVYIFSTGSNDIADYFQANSTKPKEEFISTLQSTFHDHLKNLYDMGARKFGIIGVPAVGCTPYSRAYNQKGGGGDGCIELLNDLAQAFHSSTASLLRKLISELPQMKYSLGNTFDMSVDMIQHYPSFGFTENKWACCGIGNFNGELPCYKPFGPNLCQNRSEYIFWDPYHPSQAAYRSIAATLYHGDTNFMTPMNFSRLIA